MADGSSIVRRLARVRVPLGFLCAALVLWLARPTLRTLAMGTVVACLGEAMRIWAAGHLQKSREVTSSGPYRWFAHPLYVGSSMMGAGLALASGSFVVALLVALYLATTLSAAIASEEEYLRGAFGDRYERYRRENAVDRTRRFSLARAVDNHEHRAVIGLAAGLLLLLWKATYN
jgi:protein-S-isoprenylcysteine O-methyltransferase Ste14